MRTVYCLHPCCPSQCVEVTDSHVCSIFRALCISRMQPLAMCLNTHNEDNLVVSSIQWVGVFQCNRQLLLEYQCHCHIAKQTQMAERHNQIHKTLLDTASGRLPTVWYCEPWVSMPPVQLVQSIHSSTCLQRSKMHRTKTCVFNPFLNCQQLMELKRNCIGRQFQNLQCGNSADQILFWYWGTSMS